MSQARIDSVQSWLSSELELRGIDAVIYTRYILNLFLNSRYTTDLQLAKKEAHIFAKLPPGSKKMTSKQKYSKRSGSGTIDKIALKKEMAANCLRSASDDVSEDTIHNFTLLVDDLYEKLNDCNLLSDSSSDEGCVGKPSKKRSESYHDAFPCLDRNVDGENEANPYLTTSVWNGKKKFGLKSLNEIQLDLKHSEFKLDSLVAQTPKENNVSKFQEPATSDGSPILQQSKLFEKNKKMITPRHTVGKRRPHPFRDLSKKSPSSRYKRKNGRSGSHFKERMDFDKENSSEHSFRQTRKSAKPKRKPGSKSLQQVSNFPKSSFGKDYLPDGKVLKSDHSNSKTRYFTVPVAQQLCQYPPVSEWNEQWQQAKSHFPHTLTQEPCRPVSLSKWFLDPESGCLEFEPAHKNKSSSATSPSSVESWLFCPSPALWDNDDNTSPDPAQSRLERLYKPSARHTSEDSADPVWEGLKSIAISDRRSAFSEFSSNKTVGHKQTTNLKQECNFPDCPLCLIDFEPAINDPKYSAFDTAQPHSGGSMFDGSFQDKGRKNTHASEQHSFLVDHWNPSQEATSSRKEIWLKNSKQISTEDELDKLLCSPPATYHHTSWSPWSAWSSDDGLFAFTSCMNPKPWDNSLNNFTYTLFEAAKFQWFVDLGLPGTITDAAKKEHSRLPAMPVLSESLSKSPPVIEQEREEYEDDLQGMTELLQSICDMVSSYSDDQVFDDVLKLNLGVIDTTPSVEFFWSHSDPVELVGGPIHQSWKILQDTPNLTQRNKHDSTNSNSSLAECIPENHIWKTARRMNSLWPTISSTRPVNVIYSEKHAEVDNASSVPPTSFTHFRPIHDNELEISEISIDSSLQEVSEPIEVAPIPDGYCEFSLTSSPKKPFKKCGGCAACDSKLRGIEEEIDKILYDGSPKVAPQTRCVPFRPKFRKIKEDKSMQTSFEQQLRLIDSDMNQSFSLRPPKANSR